MWLTGGVRVMSGDFRGNIVNSGDNNFGNFNSFGSGIASGHLRDVHDDVAAQGDAVERSGGRERNVFVVFGRDTAVRSAMFDFLRGLDLRPLQWEDAVHAGGASSPFLDQVVAQMPGLAQAALVLLTPDDLVMLHPDLRSTHEPEHEMELSPQPRPNVLIELGMLLMAYPERTVIVQVGAGKPISDLAGRNVIRFDGSAPALGKIAERLKAAGCAVDITGDISLHSRSFEGLNALRADRGR
ncbi:nucleotide-binding protein [Streptomyces sp. NPDC002755]|uniref:nucleotide-binding protein n=1 Tax=Streptomyces sp. NPDC002884 TaxID=3154544 RepID=UPI00331691B8